ncbi:MAG: ABC transporter ATP-binding protein [Promethearchaeota archaeon]
MGVVIDTPQLRMEIKFVSVESLYTHEETIPAALDQLQQELLEEQILKHPIIVDLKTNVVLDGMHRVAALKNLQCEIAPVCLVNYLNPAIELYAWYREFDGDSSFKSLLSEVSSKGRYKQLRRSSKQAYEIVNARKAMAALASGKKAFLLTPLKSPTIKEIYDKIVEIEVIAQKMSFETVYSTEADALASLQSEKHPVLIVPSLTKEEVVESALQKILFAHKTTRHVVPARPLFTNVPLSWLKEKNLEEANQKLFAYLKSKRIIKKEPGSVIDGRRYEEHTYLFTDP